MAQHIGDLLQSGNPFMPQAKRLMALQRAVEKALPPGLQRGCKVANLRESILVLFAANNALAAKLHVHVPGIVRALDEAGFAGLSLKVEVRPEAARASPGAKKAHVPGSAAPPLQQLIDRLPEDALREHLQSLKDKAR